MEWYESFESTAPVPLASLVDTKVVNSRLGTKGGKL